MWKTKLCLGIGSKEDPIEQLERWKKIGFEGYFVVWQRGMNLQEIRAKGDELGLLFQSVHAPYVNSKYMWEENTEESKNALEELLQCLSETAEAKVPIMVTHAFIGFQDHTPTEAGIRNYGVLFAEAEKLGVKIALENTEGEEYLDALMKAFWNSSALGFCWDTGHEMCYNHSQDMLAKYGEKLVATHLNDNLGIRDYHGEITYRDDLHLLPFDGIGDWDFIVDRLNRLGFDEPLTFELKRKSQKNRFDNEQYEKMGIDAYYAAAYASACRVATLKERRKQK